MFGKKFGLSRGQVGIGLLLTVIIGVVAVAVLLPMVQTATIGGAIARLSNEGYIVLAAGEYNTIIAKLDSIATKADAAVVNAESAANAANETLITLLLHNENEVFLWPESVTDTCTVRAGIPADTFGAWAEIADNHGVKLSANFTSQAGYIVEIVTHDYSEITIDDVIIELATDAAGANVIGRLRTRTDWTYFLVLRSTEIPAGSSLYYRMKSDVGNSTLQADFRYYHSL